MELFAATLSRMGYLFTFIFLGYLLRKKNVLPKESATVISKLENNLLLPAMVFNTFSGQFTTKNLVTAGRSLLCSAGIIVAVILFAVLVGRFLTKDGYLKNIYTYGLSFSNFAFMGYAVVQAIFPEYYLEYLIFTMPMWTAIYLWGVPALLIPDTDGKGGLLSRLKSFCNPMFIFMGVGIVFGLAGWAKWIPAFALDVIGASEKCMSPLAMMLAGITLSEVNLKTVFGDGFPDALG